MRRTLLPLLAAVRNDIRSVYEKLQVHSKSEAQSAPMTFTMAPIGYVRSSRSEPTDDFWGGLQATIDLTDGSDPESLVGIESFSHAEILYVFHLVPPDRVVKGARHPRNNPLWPAVGIHAQRAKNRPNRIGSTLVRIRGRAGRSLLVSELDAIDGTPVLDIKPVMMELLPREPVVQPDWSRELMARYWARQG